MLCESSFILFITNAKKQTIRFQFRKEHTNGTHKMKSVIKAEKIYLYS